MDIICRKLANEMLYAYHNGRFWRWDEGRSIWKESHLMAQKFERARAALKTLTPESFFSNGAEFALLDDYEISLDMTEALKNAKPCKNAPVEPVEDDSFPDAPAACICSTCTCGGCKEECFGNCRNCGHPVQECNSYQTEGEKHLTPAHSADIAERFGNIPAAPSFDFSALGDLSQQAADADQQFDLHYGAAQDEYLISCIYLARIHALTAKAGRYGGGTWTKWYESKGLSEGSVRTMVKNGEAFNSATVAELKQLPELTRKDLNLIARSGCAAQLVEAAGDSQRVQELLVQLKAKEYKLNETQARLKSACIQEQESRDAMNTANAQLEAANADIKGLTEQNNQLKSRLDAAEARKEEAEKQLEGSRQVAEAAKRRADKWQAEAEAARKQPIEAVVDEEEVERRANQKAHDIAEDLAADMTADLREQLERATSGSEQEAHSSYDAVLLADRSFQNIGKMVVPSLRRLPPEQREQLTSMLVHTLGQIQGEVSRCL